MMILPATKAPATATATFHSFRSVLAELIADKWQLVTEGPSGAQLKHPRVMTTQTKVILVIGAVGLLAWGFGLIFLVVGLVDFYALTKEQFYFLSRESPEHPPEVIPRKMPRAIKLTAGLIVAIIVAAFFI